jgi:branched-chain amino acid transport system permease protein
MATVALGIVADNVVLFTFGKEPRGFPALGFSRTVPVAGIKVQALQISSIPVVGLAGGRDSPVLPRTRYGKACSRSSRTATPRA